MAFLDSLPAVYPIIKKLVEEENRSHVYVSEELKKLFPCIPRGLSSRTVRRYCVSHGIYRTSRLKADTLNRVIRTNIEKVAIFFVNKAL